MNDLRNLRLLHDKQMQRSIGKDPGRIAEGLELGIRKM